MRLLNEYPVLQKGLKTVQIIVFALLAGVVTFLVILLVMHADQGPREPAVEGAVPLTWVLLGFGVMQVFMIVFLRSILLGRARRKIADGSWQPPGGRHPYAEAGDAGRLFTAWSTATIVTAAGMEAAALMALVAYLIEGREIALVAAGVFGLLLALQMPTRSRLDQWLESEQLKLNAPKEDVREG